MMIKIFSLDSWSQRTLILKGRSSVVGHVISSTWDGEQALTIDLTEQKPNKVPSPALTHYQKVDGRRTGSIFLFFVFA
jgi:hypothetical protein